MFASSQTSQSSDADVLFSNVPDTRVRLTSTSSYHVIFVDAVVVLSTSIVVLASGVVVLTSTVDDKPVRLLVTGDKVDVKPSAINRQRITLINIRLI